MLAFFGVLAAVLASSPPAGSGPLIYLSDPADGNLNAYSQREPSDMVLQIQHLATPGPLWVDSRKQVFVAQEDGWIFGYRPGATQFFTRFEEAWYAQFDPVTPVGLCGDRAGSVYYAEQAFSNSAAFLALYHIGNPNYLSYVEFDTNGQENILGCAVDAAGDVIASIPAPPSGSYVEEFFYPPFSGGYAILPVPVGTLLIDRSNNLVDASYCGSSPCITVYAPPYTGSPLLTITSIPVSGPIALDATGKHLWTVTTSNGSSQLLEFGYPSGKAEYASPSLPFSPGGLALSPPVSPQ